MLPVSIYRLEAYFLSCLISLTLFNASGDQAILSFRLLANCSFYLHDADDVVGFNRIFGRRTNKNTDSSVEERSGLNMMR